jgi:hypothetical protein
MCFLLRRTLFELTLLFCQFFLFRAHLELIA